MDSDQVSMKFLYPYTNPEHKTRADFYSLLETFAVYLLYVHLLLQWLCVWELEIYPLLSE